jgi:hypothetical protein
MVPAIKVNPKLGLSYRHMNGYPHLWYAYDTIIFADWLEKLIFYQMPANPYPAR